MLNRTTRYNPKAKHASLYWQYSSLLTEIKQDEIRRLKEQLNMSSEDLDQMSIKIKDMADENKKLRRIIDEKDRLIASRENERNDFDFCE